LDIKLKKMKTNFRMPHPGGPKPPPPPPEK
jgi:hypothetical protein